PTDATPLDYVAIGLDHRMIIGAQSSGEIHARSTVADLASPSTSAKKDATVLPGEIWSFAGAPAGTDIAFSCGSGDVLLWKEGSTIPARLPGAGRSSSTVRWLSDGRLVAIGNYSLRIFSPETHELFAEYPIP